MNLKFKFKFDLPTLLKLLHRFGPPLLSLVLVGVFGYTGWVVNNAFHVEPTAPAASPKPKIVFDKKTIETVKNLRVVPGQVTPGDLGKTDPFGN
jgi:hypothetical protein